MSGTGLKPLGRSAFGLLVDRNSSRFHEFNIINSVRIVRKTLDFPRVCEVYQKGGINVPKCRTGRKVKNVLNRPKYGINPHRTVMRDIVDSVRDTVMLMCGGEKQACFYRPGSKMSENTYKSYFYFLHR